MLNADDPQTPIFIISLSDAVERRKRLERSLSEAGLTWQVWPAVDGRQGLAPEHERRVDRKRARKRLYRDMKDSEFGCALSHADLYSNMLEQDLDTVIVLEDDAIVGPHFGDLVPRIGGFDGDLLLLDHEGAYVDQAQVQEILPEVTAHRMVANAFRTTGYVVRRAAAQRMLSAYTPVSHTADWPIDLSVISAWAANPRVIDHPDDESDSSIGGGRRPTGSQRRRRLLNSGYYADWFRRRREKRRKRAALRIS